MYRFEPIAQPSGLFKLKVGRCLLHVGVEPIDDLVGVTVEKLTQLGDELPVGHLVDLTDTRSGTLLDVEQQARPAESLVLVELALRTGPDREATQQQVECVADRVRMGVRPEVAGVFSFAATHHLGARPLLTRCHSQERVTLVVAEPHVESRVVLLDEAVLQHQRFDFVRNDGPLNRLRRPHHLRRTSVHVARILKVVRQALTQVRCLAHVDDAAIAILELVRTRRFRDRACWWTLDHAHIVPQRPTRRAGHRPPH